MRSRESRSSAGDGVPLFPEVLESLDRRKILELFQVEVRKFASIRSLFELNDNFGILCAHRTVCQIWQCKQFARRVHEESSNARKVFQPNSSSKLFGSIDCKRLRAVGKLTKPLSCAGGSVARHAGLA